MIRRPPRSTRTDTLFPYTTLFRSMSQARLTEPALTALDSVGLEPRAHTRASDMAHGQQRQLELAMVLAGQPKLLLLDEPMARSEEHTSELQSLMRISYAVFCLKKKTNCNVSSSIQYNYQPIE